MSWLVKKMKQWGAIEPSPEEKKIEVVKKLTEKGEEEMEPTRKEKAEKEKADDDLKLVIDGAKIECTLCTMPEGKLTVNLDTPTTQNKKTATTAEKDAMSLIFNGNCTKSPQSASACKAVMQLEEWENTGDGRVQGKEPLLLKSTIKCSYGGSPITITDCGQKHEPEEIEIEGAPTPVDEEPEKVKYVVNFETLSTYNGEFGFDWMRKEYLPEDEGGKGICVAGLDELKKLYKPFEMDIKNQKGDAYGNYYSPWVSIFPNHKEKIGKEVQLIMKVDFDFMENDVPYDEIMTFESSDPAIKVGVVQNVYNASTGKSNVILVPSATFDSVVSGVLLQINCTSEINEDATIDIVSSDGLTVGQLNVIKNIGCNRNTLNLRMVYVKKAEVTNDIQNIENEIQKIGGYQVLENYLNKKVFCQSLIQCKIFREDPEHGILQMDFSNYSLTELGKVYKDGKLTDGALRYFQDRFKRKRNTHRASQKNGIFIFLTSIDSVDANGAGMSYPKEANGLIMYADGISNNISTYAHELGHVLGLLHSFLDKDNDTCNLISTEDEMNKVKTKLLKNKRKLRDNKSELKENKDSLKENELYKSTYGATDSVLENINKIENNCKTLEKNIKTLNYNIASYQDKIKVLTENKIHFKRAKTENIMDYNWDLDCSTQKKAKNPNKRITFNKHQWDLMLKDIKYYL